MNWIDRVEITKFTNGPDGNPPAYYRMAELYFSSEEQMQTTLNSPEGKATLDLPDFATDGVTSILGTLEG